MSTRPADAGHPGNRVTRDRRPLPLQVRDHILELIDQRHLGPGDKLPTEAEIADIFGVARTTAREALKLLEQDSVITVRHGLGRFISQLPTLERPITNLESVTDMMQSRGYTVTNRVVSAIAAAASATDSEALAVPIGTEVIRLERVRLHNTEPLIYSVDVFPRALVEEPLAAVDWSGSLLELLDARGVRVASASAHIRSAHLPDEGLRAIGVDSADPKDPWILLVQRHIDDLGRPVIFSHDYYRGDRFAFNVVRRRESLGRGAGG